VADLLKRGIVFRDFPDEDLFEFAFNKSNLDSADFDFQRYEWREHTQVERSSFKDEDLLFSVWDAAEDAVKRFNDAWLELRVGMRREPEDTRGTIRDIVRNYPELFDRSQSTRVSQTALEEALSSPPPAPPQLIRSINQTNVVFYKGIFYAIPQALGPLDLSREDPRGKQRVFTATSLKEIMDILNSGP
jgi:hypothetical protein